MERLISYIHGYNKEYAVTNYGEIVSYKKSGVILKPKITTGGYYSVMLYKNGDKKTYLVHRLVALHFIKNAKNKKEVNHKDGNKLNNMSSNLNWVTSKENSHHAFKIGLRKQRITLAIANEIRQSNKGTRYLAIEYGISRYYVDQIKKHKKVTIDYYLK